MDVILNNIEWIFSGIGVVIVSAIVRTIYKKYKADTNIIVKKSKRTEIKKNQETDIKVLDCEDTIIEGNKS